MVIFPMHPRTRRNIYEAGIELPMNIVMVDPLGYLEFRHLLKNAKGLITNSVGITEEATYLGVPYMTLRPTTHRPETCLIGSNVLIVDDFHLLFQCISDLLKGDWKTSGIPQFWDGKVAERIVQDLISLSPF
jgi:UDP-N-acetylglucosamine 2-epimerase (non-hydrolysing)